MAQTPGLSPGTLFSTITKMSPVFHYDWLTPKSNSRGLFVCFYALQGYTSCPNQSILLKFILEKTTYHGQNTKQFCWNKYNILLDHWMDVWNFLFHLNFSSAFVLHSGTCEMLIRNWEKNEECGADGSNTQFIVSNTNNIGLSDVAYKYWFKNRNLQKAYKNLLNIQFSRFS